MDYIKVTINTTHAGIDAVTGVLLDLGVEGFEISDAQDFREFLEDTQPRWDYVDDSLLTLLSADTEISVYLGRDADGESMKDAVSQKIEELRARDEARAFGTLSLREQIIYECDYIDNWKEYFKPVKIGERLYIKPSWEALSDPEGRAVLQIDPGVSFGTGTHETTKLCLTALDRHVKGSEHILDLGCGSGILAIAALLLCAKSAHGVDINADAVRVTEENAAMNKIPPGSLRVFCTDILRDGMPAEIAHETYDIVCANLVSDLIIAFSPCFRALMCERGLLIASGVIDTRRDEVCASLREHGLAVVSCEEENGWCCILCRQVQE